LRLHTFMKVRRQSLLRWWGSAQVAGLIFIALPLHSLRLTGVDGDLRSVWEAVESNDPRELRRQLPGGDCHVTRDSDGHSPLTLAASKGSFECVRELLWGGALADEPNEKGLVAKQCLQSGTPGFMALNLLIRCHAFGQLEGKIKPRSGVPHRVLLIDTFVDPAHPDYADH